MWPDDCVDRRHRCICSGNHRQEKSLVASSGIDTTPEWIAAKTGILERRFVSPEPTASDLATEAALRVLEQAEMHPDDVDLFVVATSTPDFTMPANTCFVLEKLDAEGVGERWT